jgi:hypothetical protein
MPSRLLLGSATQVLSIKFTFRKPALWGPETS